ncbi:hypothetical protein FQR65_LT15215 [Abscondita terminalis]|nr:hypothetical protein FQR65_LT15215 [Abscondita terminalis]
MNRTRGSVNKKDIDYARNSVDEVVDFIDKELIECIADLKDPNLTDQQNLAVPTKGTARALRTVVLAYAAKCRFNKLRIQEPNLNGKGNMVAAGAGSNPIVPVYSFLPGGNFEAIKSNLNVISGRLFPTQYWPYSGAPFQMQTIPTGSQSYSSRNKQQNNVGRVFEIQINNWLNITDG